jgi:hypothetical protein
MEVFDKYKIKDIRPSKDLKLITFNKFKKKDVLKFLHNQIKNQNIDNANYWGAELIISGNLVELFEKIIEIYVTEISMKNPKYIVYLWNQYELFTDIVNELDDILQSRDLLEIRNMFANIITTLATSNQLLLPKIEKINALELTNYSRIRVQFPNRELLATFIKSNDPVEIFTPMNELLNHMKNPKNCSQDMVIYWLSWLILWETEYVKKNNIGALSERPNERIDKIHWRDFVWLLWEIILMESNWKGDATIKDIIDKNYRFYVYFYNRKNKFKKIYFLIYSMLLFIRPCDFTTPYWLVPTLIVYTIISKKKNHN